MSKYIAKQAFTDKFNTSNHFKKGDPIGTKLSKERIEELTRKGFIKEEAASQPTSEEKAKAAAEAKAKSEAEAKAKADAGAKAAAEADKK